MWLNFALALLCTALIILAGWGFKGKLLTPVKLGSNTRITLAVEVNGTEPCLEHTLKSLVWLHDNGTLRADVVLLMASHDPATNHIAETYARNYNYIYCDYGDNSWKSSQN